ncbi:tigger transposable element-derived protein 1-like isoform X1 [Octodon degus]|uniref:Tigger transposable element-derived protein 1-like isoform X1 n=1 Tax=Octodon degus TaxID=10160 RepID=A0A6P6ET67_OCTDE|nr:tigger transposable element-derived protein 1-like isoform X1 [Octodon degus]
MAPKKVQSSHEGKKKVQSKDGKKKVLKKITIALKKEIVQKYEHGIRVTDLALEYKMAKSTISTILKNKDAIKGADVAKGVTTLTKQRTQVLEEVEKLLLVWLDEKQQAGDSVSEAMICEKARKLHSDLLQENPSTSSTSDKFKASRGWFDKFRKRSGILRVVRHGEASSSDKAVAEAYKKEFSEFMKAEGYVAQQVLNCSDSRLFRKKMPIRTYITPEEKALPGQSEQQRALVEKFSPEKEEDRDELSSDMIKSIMAKWNECQDFFERHHPNITITNRVLKLMNDNVVSHFRRVMQRRKKQMTLGRFFVKIDPAAKKQRREETTEANLPDVLMVGDSSNNNLLPTYLPVLHARSLLKQGAVEGSVQGVPCNTWQRQQAILNMTENDRLDAH